MDRAVLITIANAQAGLLLSPDMSFYASEVCCHQLRPTVDLMHRRQLNPAAYDAFADVVSDVYARRQNGMFIHGVMVCAAIANTYPYMARWYRTAHYTAINIHLNTIGAVDRCRDYPRIVPPALADWRIEKPEHITYDLLWRILVTEPWLGYAERMRAQYARMAEAFSHTEVDRLPEQIKRLDALQRLSENKRQLRMRQRTTRHRIRRAYKLHERLFGLKRLRSVLRDRLVLTGHYYCYRLTVDAGDLELYSEETNTGTPPIHITLLRKTDQAVLGTLCIYFEDTPLIDFLTAILLHLKTPALELELLQTGQVQNVTSAFFRDPMLPELKGMRDPATAPDTYITNLINHVNGDEAYETMRGIATVFDWEPLVEEMMGYPKALLRTMAHQGPSNPWAYIMDTEPAAPILTAVKQYFRSAS